MRGLTALYHRYEDGLAAEAVIGEEARRLIAGAALCVRIR